MDAYGHYNEYSDQVIPLLRVVAHLYRTSLQRDNALQTGSHLEDLMDSVDRPAKQFSSYVRLGLVLELQTTRPQYMGELGW